MQILPLRPEQEAEPLARLRFEELSKLVPADFRVQLEAARRAKFPNDRQRRRHFERHGETPRLTDKGAYEDLIAAIQADPERIFGGYKPEGTQGALLRWIFARDDTLVVVGTFDPGEIVLTCHRAK